MGNPWICYEALNIRGNITSGIGIPCNPRKILGVMKGVRT
jgi:hypothetical protein